MHVFSEESQFSDNESCTHDPEGRESVLERLDFQGRVEFGIGFWCMSCVFRIVPLHGIDGTHWSAGY